MKKNNGRAIAVIQFPGVNCEFETARAVRSLGFAAEVVRWNRTDEILDRFAGFVLPGGFSYQDRVRGGVIASREPVVEVICEAAKRGKPILGICNGAQILVEAGLIPGRTNAVEVALAPNRNAKRTGYYCDWVTLRCEPGRSFLSKVFRAGELLPLPVAHAEGRFVSANPELLPGLLAEGQIPLRYCTPSGETADTPPHCPNGSTLGAAALANREGNVLAMMPHPERASWLHQVPEHLGGAWGERRRALLRSEVDDLFLAGPGRKVIEAFCLAAGEGDR
jgi:phosphoribosylformylglycinamidine synthase